MPFKHYDDKLCFDAWIQTGSIHRATSYLEKQGIRAVDGVSFPHPTTVYMCAIRHIINNPEETRQPIIDSFVRGRQYKSDPIWEWKLIKWARTLFLTSGNVWGFYLWLIQNDLDERAKELKIINPKLTRDHVLSRSKS